MLNIFSAPGATGPFFQDLKKRSDATYIRPRDGADVRVFDFTKLVKNCFNDPK